ncbi:sulfatase [Candidatus Bathyarchaeota archaeon]|nr:sulfatase [Candidatus Bathyarchaeota archaeon]
MNIIVIVSDTFRWDFLGCYGNEWIRTPCLDKFAEKSIVFDKAYTGSFPTVPHRSDLFTGRYCFHTRGWAPLSPEEDTFPKMLRRAGYYTKMVTDTGNIVRGAMNFYLDFDDWEHISRDDLPEPKRNVKVPCPKYKFRFPERGYRLYPYLINLKEDEFFCARTMRRAADWLEKNYKRDDFLLYVDTFDPHEPWLPPQEYIDLYDPEYEDKGDIVFFPRYDYADYLTSTELKHMRALYAGMVTLVDKWVGFLLDKIGELGLFENSAVIFTSDHGFYHGEHGRIGKHTVLNGRDNWPLYEEVSHIPLIMSIPEMPKSKRCDALIQPVDIMATILDLAGISIPKYLHGRSVLPILKGETSRIRDIAVSSGGPYFQPGQHCGVTRPPWLALPPYMKPFVLSPDPEYISHSTITDGEWTLLYATKGVHAELYNLRRDPKQENNVISENLEVARRLHRKFYAFLRDIGASERILRLRREL